MLKGATAANTGRRRTTSKAIFMLSRTITKATKWLGDEFLFVCKSNEFRGSSVSDPAICCCTNTPPPSRRSTRCCGTKGPTMCARDPATLQLNSHQSMDQNLPWTTPRHRRMMVGAESTGMYATGFVFEFWVSPK